MGGYLFQTVGAKDRNSNDNIFDTSLIIVPVVGKKLKMLKITIHAHGFTTTAYTPMVCLNVDFIGPFPDQGYILVIACTFTRWVELYHTIDASKVYQEQSVF